MRRARIGCIVEGQGDVLGLPILIKRIVQYRHPDFVMSCELRRIQRSQLVQEGQLERAVEALTRQVGRSTPLLVLLDADKDCPVALARDLLKRCDSAHRDVSVSIVIATCEYEAWFLAGADSLAGKGGLGVVSAPSEPDAVRGAKEWLSARMTPGMRYSETRHQPLYSKRSQHFSS